MTPELSSEESLGDIEIGSEAYDCLGTTVADLHFLPFPSASDASGQRIYSLATAIAAPPKDKDTDGRIVSEGKIANSGLLGKSLQDSTLNGKQIMDSSVEDHRCHHHDACLPARGLLAGMLSTSISCKNKYSVVT